MDRFSLEQSIHRILAATTVEEVWEHVLDRINAAGFKNALYGFTRFHTPSGFGNENDHLILTNFDADYLNGYLDEGRWKHAPMVRWSVENSGACPWSWIEENMDSMSQKELDVIAFNQKMGVTAGFTLAFPHAIKRTKGALGMAMAPGSTQEQANEIWEKYGARIELIAGVAHLKLLSMPLPKRLLTNRQREVLEWIGDGKTVADTAEILGLNKATVEKHLRLAREALGVETTAQAVLKASFHNQMFTF
ncbi:helix-turn-helix transcriptional regulator [Celeribacter litoreus]|uniref:helix-turn-helix transcriptional regulator n=1 Tax=Celeribacter litoreus TaxID=2876714 RepID=UPI001CC9B25B|nr:LuxR family transcriptional regulator [Celeribacter litoreus]MCA0043797.1 LuxR family transcriptional regulator [Celeribacter litoreus]